MERKDIKKLFPLKAFITENDMKLTIGRGGLHFLGDILLKKLLPETLHEHLFWGLSIGTIKGIEIKTEYKEDGINLPLYIDNNFKGNELIFELR